MNRLIWTVLGCLWVAGCGAAPGGGGGGPRPTPSPSYYPPPGGAGRMPQPSPSPTSTAPATRRTSQAVVVVVRDFQFEPASIVVTPGTAVTWRFEGAVAHTTTSDPESPVQWDSGLLASGQAYSRTFDTPGNFPYHCTVHPRMAGVVVVR